MVLTAFLLFANLVGATRSLAEEPDAVWVQSHQGGARVAYRGQIAEIRGGELTLIQGTRSRQISMSRVLELQTTWPDEYQAANDLIFSGHASDALPMLIRSLQRESRGWAKREIMASIVKCADRLAQLDTACQYFLQLVQEDPDTHHFGLIPLSWVVRATPGHIPSRVSQWISTNEPVQRLVAASYLLTGPDRIQASEALRQLSDHRDPRIAHLATAQLWRLALVTAAPQDIERWRQQLQRMPQGLRAGPSFVLAQAKANQGQIDSAVVLYISIAITHPEHYQLSADALNAAARTLQVAGRDQEAERVVARLRRDYPNALSLHDGSQTP